MAEPVAINVTRAPTTAPAVYTVPGSADVELLSAFAHFDGTAAATSWLPTLTFYSDAGLILARVFPSSPVVAGGTADVTFAPFLGNQVDAATIINAVTLDDYVFKFANTVLNAVGFNDNSDVIIQGNPIQVDGNTRIKIEFFTPCVEIVQGDLNQAVGFQLWDDTVNKGTIAYTVGNENNRTGQLENCVYSSTIITPTAGIHTYRICAWRNIAADTCTVFANTFVDGSGNFGPAWYRVTQT